MTLNKYNYAIYTELVFGKRTFQGQGHISDGEWLPVAEPRQDEQSARLDCFIAHRELQKLGLAHKDGSDYNLDPTIHIYDWSGPRRILK